MLREDNKGRTNLGSDGNAQEMDKTDVLISDYLDLVDKTKAAQVIPQHLLGHVLVQSTKVHVPTRVALADSQCDLAWHRRRLPPTDLELLSVKSQLLDSSIRVECRSRGAV